MNKKISDYIKTLTKADKKNLSQKTLKTVEEVGELAKVILPYENAFATTHRFVDKKRILEECADTYLCLMSLVYDLDFSDEEFEEMVSHKMKAWADLQAREGRIKYPVPFEIHITVDMGETKSIDKFKKVCKTLGVKPILLDLHMRDGNPIKDMMTSSTYMGNNREAFEEMKRISLGLDIAGFKVIREKIETIPWHPAAPSYEHENPFMPPNCYFECHLNVLCTEDKKEKLKILAENHGAKRSSNVFKKFDDGSFTIMVTYRNYETLYEDFKERVSSLKRDIQVYFEVEKEIIEFSIYDTKVSHDAAWILQSNT